MILVTGGAGFIGANFVLDWLAGVGEPVVNLDKLTYAGNLENLQGVESAPNYTFVKGDINDPDTLDHLFESYRIDGLIHLAAESHVDRSIENPMSFIETNIVGTVQLLNAARRHWKDFSGKRFYHVSTDEVFGSLGDTGYFTEATAYDPRSPFVTSGLRLGTPSVTTQGMREAEMEQIAAWMDEAARHSGDEAILSRIAGEVRELCTRFPAPGLTF